MTSYEFSIVDVETGEIVCSGDLDSISDSVALDCAARYFLMHGYSTFGFCLFVVNVLTNTEQRAFYL